MKALKLIDGFLNRLEGYAVILMLLTMLLLGFLQVVLRNVFSGGIVWGDVLLRHLVLWLGFIGAALAASQERHINIDALTRFLPRRLQAAIHALTNLFAAAVCALLFRASLTFIDFEVADGHTVYGEVPSIVAEIIIPVGFALLAVHFLIRVAVRIREAAGKEQPA